VAVALAASSGGFAYFLPAVVTAYDAINNPIAIPSPSSLPSLFSPDASANPTPQQQGAFTVLLLGSDDDSKFFSEHVLTQSMILVRVIPSTKQVIMLSIPRDLYVPFWTGGSGKIDGAYSYGQAGGAIATVQQDFGVHINDYIWIGLLGLVKLIDAIGGIDVVTSAPVIDDYYPSDIYSRNPYDYERVAVLGGPQHLDGIHAMQYVRSRHNDLQSDIGRSKRQQQVLLSLKSKLDNPDIFGKLATIANQLKGSVKTDMQLTDVLKVMDFAKGSTHPVRVRKSA